MSPDGRVPAWQRDAEAFIATLAQRYAVAPAFIQRCCPMIAVIFQDFGGAERERLLLAAEAAVARHAETVAAADAAAQELNSAVRRIVRYVETQRSLELRVEETRTACAALEDAVVAKKRVLH